MSISHDVFPGHPIQISQIVEVNRLYKFQEGTLEAFKKFKVGAIKVLYQIFFGKLAHCYIV